MAKVKDLMEVEITLKNEFVGDFLNACDEKGIASFMSTSRDLDESNIVVKIPTLRKMKKLNVLIGCEYSGIVRDAFTARGHYAVSCDLLPTESKGPHIRGDVLRLLDMGWDLMIAHPPCTYFSRAGMHYLKKRPERKDQLKKAFEFWLALWNCSIPKIAIENPVGWLSTNWRKPTQIIQPYYFGDNEQKTTCLWLKGLSRLNGKIDISLSGYKVEPKGFVIRKTGPKKGQKYNYYWIEGKSAKGRAKFWPGIAEAMAAQWG